MSAKVTPITRPDAVDASCRWPVLKLTLGATAWLLAGLMLKLGSGLMLHLPALAICEYANYGKLAAAARVALIYGFALPAGFGIGIWLLFRNSDRPLTSGLAVLAGAVIWNLGVTAGVAGILLGEGSGIVGFDFPGYSGSILLAGYFLMGVAVIPAYGAGQRKEMELSQVMVLAAALWFPWLLTSAQILLVWFPVRGVLSALVGGWYFQALLWGCLAPLTLAGLLHFRTGLNGASLPRPALAWFGWWGLLAVAGFVGATTLIGGPYPAWVASAGVVAGVLLSLPVILLGLNLFAGGLARHAGQPALQLATVSGLSFVIVGLLSAATSLRCANRILRFSMFPGGLQDLFLFGFLTLGLLAGLYVILPRLIGFAWQQPLLTYAHIGLSVMGVGLMVLSLLVGGWQQGQRLDSVALSVSQVNAGLWKFMLLNALGLVILIGGQMAFVAHVAWLVGRHFPTVKEFVLSLIREDVRPAAALVRSAK